MHPGGGERTIFDRKERKEKRDKTQDLSVITFVFFAISAVKSYHPHGLKRGRSKAKLYCVAFAN